MCGIFAILGIRHNNYHKILQGLRILQNRGYDSAGVCSMLQNEFILSKFATDEKTDSIDKLDSKHIHSKHLDTTFSISHTRWATHGPKTNVNSHPHMDNDNMFSIVHNGIIENYQEIKNMLLEKGFHFYTQTDTEILVNLISYHYQHISTQQTEIKKRIIQSIELSMNQCKGTMGVCLMCTETPNTLYIFRKGSPLVFCLKDDYVVVSSEQLVLQQYHDQYVIPDENQVFMFTKKDNKIHTNMSSNTFTLKKIEQVQMESSPYPYDHWTLKEIHSIPKYVKCCVKNRVDQNNNVILHELENHKDLISSKGNIIFLGCGSSLYASMFAKKFFHKLQLSDNIHCINACEFDLNDYSETFLNDSLFILVSQSGETYDLIHILNKLNNSKLTSIGVVNRKGSFISSNTTCCVYTHSGNEVGVAATKSYINQVITLLLIGSYMNQITCTEHVYRKRLLTSINKFVNTFSLSQISNNIQCISEIIKDHHSMFILGTQYTEHIAQEGSLKIKELTYIHCESYSMGELKHGPLSLIFGRIPIIYFCLKSNDNTRLRSSLSETKIRNSTNIVISDYTKSEITYILDMDTVDHVITITDNDLMSPLVSVIPIQILSYYVAVSKGYDPDKPRNLAKTVTVE